MAAVAVVAPFFPCHHPLPIFHHCHHYHKSTRNPILNPLRKFPVPTIPPPVLGTNSLSPVTESSLLGEITKLCESKFLTEALDLLQGNPGETFLDQTQKSLALGILLQACGVQKDIEIGRQVHRLIRTSTHLRDDPVLNTRIITMYSMCGSPLESRFVFDRLQEKNLYQWNALLKGYTRNELYCDALCLFEELVLTTRYRPDNFTFPCVIKSCGEILDVDFGKLIHGMAVKLGLAFDVYVNNALIVMYGKFGSLHDASRLFEHMPERNLVSWNSIISVMSQSWHFEESFNLFFELLLAEELSPDSTTLVIILPACAGDGGLMKGKVVHGLAVKLGISEDLMVTNALVDTYSKFGLLCEARILFDSNANKSVVSWNSIIGGYSREGDVDGTFDLLRKMHLESSIMKPDEVTVLNTLSVCSTASQLLSLKELHGYSIRHGFEDELLSNAFITSYARCGLIETARILFDRSESKTVSTYNAYIAVCAQNVDCSKALDICLEMRQSGINADAVTVANLLVACSHLKLLLLGKQVHGFVLRNGLEADHFISSSLISFYFRCEVPRHAQALFNMMDIKGLVDWNALISGYFQNNLPSMALDCFRQMLSDGYQPDEITMVSALGAISQLSALQIGKEAHCFSLKADLLKDNLVVCALIDMYAKSGLIEFSEKIFDLSQDKDAAIFSAMISGYAIHGHGELADMLFRDMSKLSLKPDHFTFIGLLNACSHAGLIENGLKYLAEMQPLHGVEPKLEHYACVVDMLARAGRFADALDLIGVMPVEPDEKIWSSLLSSCIIHNELSLGKNFVDKLLEVAPNRAESYVLVSNFYATFRKWDDVRRVRGRMKEIGLQKDVGCSWTEVGGKSYSFIASDEMLPD
ncbi:OLC1v1013997C1 [Oldenlandia corymbosa var. corymbosa]|uniref:OLC1v1013997C1 n=1 Tax=Oldenlandia corymbosa var. corymbosa TaxID=529605 RepID=A0AAV1E1T6_OLDCO|nr:OLC1v1013997C1 [Oldenlandia corymbosa var. corymbosa]